MLLFFQEKVEQSVDEAYETFKSHAEYEPR